MKEIFYTFVQELHNKKLFRLHMCGTSTWKKRDKSRRRYATVGRIEYIESGSATVFQDDIMRHVEAGDCYFLQPYHYHEYYTDSDEILRKHFINISGPLFDSMIDGYKLKNIITIRELDISEELKEIIELGKNKSNDHTEKIIKIIGEIFYKMHYHIYYKNQHLTDGVMIKEYINQNIYNTFNIKELCSIMKKSESQLRRNFKKEFGISPYEYFLQQKIEKAKQILKNTNVQIKQIAYDLNFSDEYYFSTTFKARTGMSPSEFRKSSE